MCDMHTTKYTAGCGLTVLVAQKWTLWIEGSAYMQHKKVCLVYKARGKMTHN